VAFTSEKGEFLMAKRFPAAWLFVTVLALLVAIGDGALAQDGGNMATELAPIAKMAKEKGMTVIVMSPQSGSDVPAADEPSMTMRGLMIRQRVRDLIVNIPNIGDQMLDALRKASPDGTMAWLWFSIAVSVAGILVANAISYIFRRINRSRMERFFNPEPQNRTDKIGYLLLRATAISINCLLMFVSAILLALIFDYGHEESRSTILVIVSAYVAYWVFRAVIFFNIIAHDLPNHRMINLDDAAARSLQMDLRNSMIAVIIAFAFSAWMSSLALKDEAHDFLMIVSSLLAVFIFAALIVKHRRPIAGAILGAGAPGSKSIPRRVLAANWHYLALVYLIAACVVSSYRLVMDMPSATILVAAPAIALVAALPVYGLILIVIDRFYAARRVRFEERVAFARAQALEEAKNEEKARADAVARDPAAQSEVIEHVISGAMAEDQFPVFKPLFKPLLERAAGILIMLSGLGFVLGAWDVRVGNLGNPITAFMDTILIVFIAWFCYFAVVMFVDDRMEVEGAMAGATNPADLEEEPGGQGATRLGTLLPLIRMVSVTTIFAITGMIVLSNLGVDIAPLFAGAGVIGLAVGFGAQTLIRDIFSGGFFLFDDAFRKGEYVELGNIRGTVEKISLRSFQLRHHNGPLHTIPFGEIKQLTNYSRDWVIMKLPLRVTYDTDVDKVRKLVKKLGEKLLEQPQIGKNFLQPLKSQGVVQMEDSAMIIRVKFMTKPGDQWVTRKIVYQEIRALFEREGIRFANKEVTVRIADRPVSELGEHQLQGVAAAAARRSLDDDVATKGQVPEVVDR
jgi:moderate conductance mechanosensitive channel